MKTISTIVTLLSAACAYIVGSFPTSYLVTKFLKGVDIRDAGSKNAGATNVFRVAGKLPGVITLILDILKGVFAVTVIAGLTYRFTDNFVYDFYRLLLGFAAISGHIWPVFLGFRGGKGVATTIGVAIVVAPNVLLPTMGIWFLVFILTGYVSLASIVSFIAFPAIAATLNSPIYLVLFSVIICLIVVYRHISNIRRLLKGEEKKTGIFKS